MKLSILKTILFGLLALAASTEVLASKICLGAPILHDTLCSIFDDDIVCLVQDACQASGYSCVGQDCIYNLDQGSCEAAGCVWMDASSTPNRSVRSVLTMTVAFWMAVAGVAGGD